MRRPSASSKILTISSAALAAYLVFGFCLIHSLKGEDPSLDPVPLPIPPPFRPASLRALCEPVLARCILGSFVGWIWVLPIQWRTRLAIPFTGIAAEDLGPFS